MSTLNLPYSMVADRDAGIKANAQHVDDDFNAVKTAVDGKLDLDGTSVPTADIPMGSHKITGVATPTASGDAATKGYVDSQVSTLSGNCVKLSGNQTIAGTKTFSSTISGSINGNAATVTNGVYTTGNQTIAGTKTFSSTIQGNISGSSGSCTGNAATATSATSATKATQDGNGNNIVSTYAPKASPAFTGTPTAPTVSSVTDNSTKIATTHFVLDVLKAVYPVNSVFIGTSSSCPLASLFGTWTKIATKIITDVNSTAPVIGNGTVLGLTDGTNLLGIENNYTTGTGYYIQTSANQYGASVGAATSPSSGSNKALGVTTDGTKSGVEANITSSSITVNVWKRTA